MPICLALTVALRIAMDRADVSYEEVKATVVSSRTVQRRVAGRTITSYEVVVSYMGKEYDLENTHNSYAYWKGLPVTAYLANGKLYANIEGITSTTPVAKLYFVCLFTTFGLLLWVPFYLDREKKKQAAVKERGGAAADFRAALSERDPRYKS